jgi:hypothetical protein
MEFKHLDRVYHTIRKQKGTVIIDSTMTADSERIWVDFGGHSGMIRVRLAHLRHIKEKNA